MGGRESGELLLVVLSVAVCDELIPAVCYKASKRAALARGGLGGAVDSRSSGLAM